MELRTEVTFSTALMLLLSLSPSVHTSGTCRSAVAGWTEIEYVDLASGRRGIDREPVFVAMDARHTCRDPQKMVRLHAVATEKPIGSVGLDRSPRLPILMRLAARRVSSWMHLADVARQFSDAILGRVVGRDRFGHPTMRRGGRSDDASRRLAESR
jgi:hypothetical protein